MIQQMTAAEHDLFVENSTNKSCFCNGSDANIIGDGIKRCEITGMEGQKR